MKRLFIETKYQGDLGLTGGLVTEILDKLSDTKTVVLACSVQYLDYLPEIKSVLESKGKKVELYQSKHGKYPGQVLGCDIHLFDKVGCFVEGTDEEHNHVSFFYLGDGLFHPSALAYSHEVDIIIFNPMSRKIQLFDKEYWVRSKKVKNALLAKLITKDNVGVLVTSKPGQNRVKDVDLLRLKLEEKGKNVFVFMGDNINTSKLEDFNFVDVWVNTACPRIIQDFPCLNIEDLKDIEYF